LIGFHGSITRSTTIAMKFTADHQNSAFYPVIDQLERALRFESIDSVELRLEKLQSEKQTRS
jgi:hypothetical protein